MMAAWQPCPVALHDDVALQDAVIIMLETSHRPHFIDQPSSNPALPILIRSFRRIENWRAFLVLTPWMLARMLVPEGDLGLLLPDLLPESGVESGAESGEKSICLLGPSVELNLLGTRHKAHLKFDPCLGNYLLQPLILNMERYPDPDAAFAAWNKVIATRTEIAKKKQMHCEWQTEISRREMFSFLRSG